MYTGNHPHFDPNEKPVDSKWNQKYKLYRYSDDNLYGKVPTPYILLCYVFLIAGVLSMLFSIKLIGNDTFETSLVLFFVSLGCFITFGILTIIFNSTDYNQYAYVIDNNNKLHLIYVSTPGFMDFTYLQEYKPKSTTSSASVANFAKLAINSSMLKKYLKVLYNRKYLELILQQNFLESVSSPVFKINSVKKFSYFFLISASFVSDSYSKPRLTTRFFRICNNISNYDELYEQCVAYMNATKALKL